MELFTDYDAFLSEFPENEYMHYRVFESTRPPYYIGASRFVLIDQQPLMNFFQHFPEFSVQYTQLGTYWNKMHLTSFKNLSKEIRQITVECLNEGSLDLFKYSVLDDGIEPFTINTEENKVTFCLKPQKPISCESSTVPVAFIEEFPDLPNRKVKINGIEYDGSDLYYTGQDLSEELPPILILDDYGASIVNTGTSCVLVEFPFNKEEHYISSLPFGVEGEWNEDGSSFLLSLAGQIFTPMNIDIMVLDENDWSVYHLNPQRSYRLQIRIHGENPDPNWKATVSIKGETYLLNINNTEQEIEFVTPPNDTNVGFKLDLGYEIHTDFEYSYSSGDSIPAFTVMPRDISENISATINSGTELFTHNYPFEVDFNFNYQTLESYYSFKSPEYFFRYGNVFISLGPIFAGCKLGFPYEDVVLDGQGSASLDLNKLPKYQTTWYTDGWSTPLISVYNLEDVLVAIVRFRTNLERVNLERIWTNGRYLDIDGRWYHTVNTPYTMARLGPFDTKVKKIKVRLTTNPMPYGANFLPPNLELDVVDGYAYFTPTTATVVYDSSLSENSWSYYTTRLVITILEAEDPILIGRVTQVRDIKVVISND